VVFDFDFDLGFDRCDVLLTLDSCFSISIACVIHKIMQARGARRHFNPIPCPVCGQDGFISKRPVWSYYYPRNYNADVFDKGAVAGKSASAAGIKKKRRKYRGSSKYYHYYIGHYDAAKYKQQKERYDQGKRKSKPNGRKWCYLRGISRLYD
jgi:hypothetical protein